MTSRSADLRTLLLITAILVLSGCAVPFDDAAQLPEALQKQSQSEVRVMSWNVKSNSIFPPDGARHASFARIVRAMQPDVIGLQEVMRPHLVAELTRLMNQYIPLENGRSWQVHTVADNALISRYPMLQTGGEEVVPFSLPELGQPGFHYGFASALIEVPEGFAGTGLCVVAMHNKSGASAENVRLRQMQSDAIVRWLREMRETSNSGTIPVGTPIVILGDMNVVPTAPMRPFQSLLSGDIADEDTFGEDVRIDWDGTGLADVKPSHNAEGEHYYTWRNDVMPFPPSALDRMIFTDSVLSVRRRFVLNTMQMSAESLAYLGLQRSDVMYDEEVGDYDHLPLVADFSLVTATREQTP